MRTWLRHFNTVIWLALLVGRAGAETIPVGRIMPVAAHDARCEFVVPSESAGDKYLLIVGSLERAAARHRIRIRTELTRDAADMPLEQTVPDAGWRDHVRLLAEKLASSRTNEELTTEYPPGKSPPQQKTFALFVKENGFQNADSYVSVTGQLQAVGKHCQVYVDRDYHDLARLRQTIADVVRTFDEQILPKARRTLGRALDVDRDGRFTILFTAWLSRLVNGQVALEGFVRGSDFYRDLPQPYSNGCDMLYLNTDLQPGPLLRTLLAHEYTHAIVFSEHIFGGYPGAAHPREEESWLNEALAHVAEDSHGYSWENLDYRVSAFLSDPPRYRLVVPDYYNAGLWRSHGSRGAAYLFVRWCADRYGDDLAGRLVRTSLAGVENVEVATGERFADLFRQWCVSLALSGTGIDCAASATELRYTPVRRIDLRGPLGGRLLCGPRHEAIALTGATRDLEIAGTAAAFVMLHSTGGTRTRVTLTSDANAALQVTLIRLPQTLPWLELSEDHTSTLGSIRLIAKAHDSPLTLEAAAWECATPTSNRPEDTSFRGSQASAWVRRWFPSLRLNAGESCASEVIDLPSPATGIGPLVFKLAATDAAGRHVAAWQTIDTGKEADRR
jgi:hypothetical protein